MVGVTGSIPVVPTIQSPRTRYFPCTPRRPVCAGISATGFWLSRSLGANVVSAGDFGGIVSASEIPVPGGKVRRRRLGLYRTAFEHLPALTRGLWALLRRAWNGVLSALSHRARSQLCHLRRRHATSAFGASIGAWQTLRAPQLVNAWRDQFSKVTARQPGCTISFMDHKEFASAQFGKT